MLDERGRVAEEVHELPFGFNDGLAQMLLKDGTLILLILLLSLSVYLALAPCVAYGFYRPILFRPLPIPKDAAAPMLNNVQGQDVELLQSGNATIHGWLFQQPNARYTILLSHGNGGNISTKIPLIELLLSVNASVLIYDYCGYGKSTGLPNPKNVGESAKCAYDYLVNVKKIKPENIILYGESLGGAVSARLCTASSVGDLVLQSSFVSLQRIASEKHPILKIYPHWLFPKENLDTAEALAKVQVPILILHGVNDAVVPYHHATELLNSARAPKRLVTFNHSAHSDLAVQEPAVLRDAINNFMSELDRS